MTSATLSQFANENYLNLETCKRDGTPVLTPVWFAEESTVLYVYSLADAGKVKRIRNNPSVRVAPCDMRGKLKGEWVDGHARILDGAEVEHPNRLLDQKYGIMKGFGNLTSKLLGRKRTFIAIELD
jgi:uncharacterized protein